MREADEDIYIYIYNQESASASNTYVHLEGEKNRDIVKGSNCNFVLS